MKSFGQFVLGLLIIALDASILAGLQWLSWHCPHWLTVTCDNTQVISPLVWVTGVVLGFYLSLWACNLCGCFDDPNSRK